MCSSEYKSYLFFASHVKIFVMFWQKSSKKRRGDIGYMLPSIRMEGVYSEQGEERQSVEEEEG
jgi:hypothetical protein